MANLLLPMNASSASPATKPTFSFVVPLKDEAPTLRTLFDGIAAHATPHCSSFEVVFIDDGSGDDSWKIITELQREFPLCVKALRFRRNRGKAEALAAGWREASGDYVFTMDADLQDDPAEISRFVAKLEEGYDIVSGWKRTRHDPWHKVLPSRVFNKMLSKVNGVDLHDHNCGFKCYRRAVVKELPMYGEMHRMVPSLGGMLGFRAAEIEVTHHPRQFGSSKYGLKRFLRGFTDMWSVWYLRNFRERPSHFHFGTAITLAGLGAACALLGVVLPVGAAAQAALFAALPMGVVGAAGLVAAGFASEWHVHRALSGGREVPVVERLAAEALATNIRKFPGHDGVEGHGASDFAILIVDDDPVASYTVAHHLTKAGCRVRVAATCAAAREELKQFPDLVLLDLYLPDGDGLSLLSEIRHSPDAPKVVLLSSESNIRAGVEAMRHGASDYLCKPTQPAQLLSVIRRALEPADGVAV